MAKRENPYEAAFESYLRERQIPYVAVDESRRSLLGNGSLKSLDFIVSPGNELPSGAEHDRSAVSHSWLVDVKGRLFPGGRNKQYWKNWSTRDDLASLAQWERLFGHGFTALFVFAYRVVGDRAPLKREQLYLFRDHWYGFVGVRLADYVRYVRPISGAWGTVAMRRMEFRRLAAPVERFFQPASRSLAAT